MLRGQAKKRTQVLRQKVSVQKDRLVDLFHFGLAILTLWKEFGALASGHLLLHFFLTLPVGNNVLHPMN